MLLNAIISAIAVWLTETLDTEFWREFLTETVTRLLTTIFFLQALRLKHIYCTIVRQENQANLLNKK